MKFFLILPFILCPQLLPAQETVAVSTPAFGQKPVKVSTPSLAENDYISQIDFEKALAEAEEMFKKNPGKYKTNYDFRTLYLAKLSERIKEDIKLSSFVNDHPDEAIKLLDKEIEINKDDFTLYDWRGHAYREKCFRRILDTKPDKESCMKAIKDFDAEIKMTKNTDNGPGYIPAKAEAYRQRGIVYKWLGENEKALESYKLALKNSSLGLTYYEMTMVLIKMGRYEEAAENLKLFMSPASRMDKKSKEMQLFDPCKKLFEKGYYVEGCPDKELFKKFNSGWHYWKSVEENKK